MTQPVLSVEGLSVDFLGREGWKQSTFDVSFEMTKGQTLAVVGESGSGKSVTAMAILGLLPPNGRRHGIVRFDGLDLLSVSRRALTSIRGRDIGVIFQEPMTALNPVYTISAQLCAAIRSHGNVSRRDAHQRAEQLMKDVHMPDARKKLASYPHQLSGGQRQRAMIAMALSHKPKVLIADEPTTALDVTVQAEVLDLLRELQDRFGTALMMITHDMGVVADIADRVVVMQQGRVVEEAGVSDLFASPQHPYTQRLLDAVPQMGRDSMPHREQRSEATVLTVENLSVDYRIPGQREPLRALDAVSLDLRPGEILGVVGESGSGKSTLGKAIVGLTKVADGRIRLSGVDSSRGNVTLGSSGMSMVFQDPASSLNPRSPIWRCITDPLRWQKVERERGVLVKIARGLLEQVEISPDEYNSFPHRLSGGQKQRIGIARAVVTRPAVLIADEPTSALDVSVQAKVLKLLKDLQEEMNFACIFISHDLAVVESLADRIIVMRGGKIVESGDARDIMFNPQEEYTRQLLAAAPVPDPVAQRERRADRAAAKAAVSNGEEG